MNDRPRRRRRLTSILASTAVLSLLATVAVLASPAGATRGQDAGDPEAYTNLALINGWTGAPFSTRPPKAKVVNGIVYLKGAMATSGADMSPFILPVGMRPNKDTYIPVDMCNAANGRLRISSNGSVSVQPEGALSDAQCFVSLEGASFVLNPTGQTALGLLNGWTGGPFSTRTPKAIVDAGIVHLRGAIAAPSGSNTQAFTLPVGMRPNKDTYVQADMCDASNGRLYIQPDGDTFALAEGAQANATCFTSLDGVSFALNPPGQTTLSLVNGWTGGPFSTRTPKAIVLSGIVHLRGAIGNGTSSTAFTLPVGMRPTKDSYVPVDLCNAHDGRLLVRPSGDVIVISQGNFSDAQCFTSLDGAAFAR